MCVRPPQSLEGRIKEALSKSGLKTAEFLELAAIAYLERSPEQMRQELAQLLESEQFNIDPSKPIPRNARRDFESPTEAGELEQGQLGGGSGTEEPTTTASDETPASGSRDTRGKKQQTGDTKTSSKGKTSPRTTTKARKTPSS